MAYSTLIFDRESNIEQIEKMRIPWESYDVTRVFLVTDYNEACSLICAGKVDIVFCNFGVDSGAGIRLARMLDDMPGIFLVMLIYRGSENLVSRPLVKYGSNWEYMFMPISPEEFQVSLKRILTFIEGVNDQERILELGYAFIRNLNIYQELFWKDILNDIIPAGRNNILDIAQQRKIRIPGEGIFLLRIRGMSDRQILKGWTKRDRMCAIRNLFVSFYDKYLLTTVFDDEYNLTAILENIDHKTRENLKEIRIRSQKLLELVQEQLGISFLVFTHRESIAIEEAFQKNQGLKKSAESYVGGISAFLYDEPHSDNHGCISTARLMKWEMLVENNAYAALRNDIDVYFERLFKSLIKKNELYILILRIWTLFERERESRLTDIDRIVEILTVHPINAMEMLRAYCIRIVDEAIFAGSQDESAALVEAVKRYIADNIYSDFGRDDIAAHVQYHPDYISRVFHEITGETLTGYIQTEKIRKAIFLFSETSMSVSQVAERLGYTNFSYFSQLFKKKTGYGVREYKKKYLEKDNRHNNSQTLLI